MKWPTNFIILCFTMVFTASVLGADPLRLVTTTSTENSGLTDVLLSEFKIDTGIDVQFVAVGTGRALAIARNGDADAILVHSKKDELEFVAQGYGVERHAVMYNDFILIGPDDDPAQVSRASTIDQALNSIASNKSLFISRGDDSGTHKKELLLWDRISVTPHGRWYRESGQGMGKTLHIAGELAAYVLSDKGTWLAQNANQPIQLKIVYQGDELLFNPYGVIAVNPEKYPHVNFKAANTFITWITSTKGQQLIADFKPDGEALFYPSAKLD